MHRYHRDKITEISNDRDCEALIVRAAADVKTKVKRHGDAATWMMRLGSEKESECEG